MGIAILFGDEGFGAGGRERPLGDRARGGEAYRHRLGDGRIAESGIGTALVLGFEGGGARGGIVAAVQRQMKYRLVIVDLAAAEALIDFGDPGRRGVAREGDTNSDAQAEREKKPVKIITLGDLPARDQPVGTDRVLLRDEGLVGFEEILLFGAE